MNGLEKLTEGEAEILRCAASGMSVKEIAQARVTSVNTVRSQVKNMLEKLGVGTQLKAVALVRETQTGDLSDDEANKVDFFMSEHMYQHSISNSIAGMGCDVGCRTRALKEAFNQVLRKRKEM